MKTLSIFSILAFVICAASMSNEAISATRDNEIKRHLSELFTDNPVTMSATWSPVPTETLVCISYLPSVSSGGMENILAIYRKKAGGYSKIVEVTPAGSPKMIMTDQRGNLLTVWEGATRYRVLVFSFLKGEIVKSLEETSDYFPEFVTSSSPADGGQDLIVSTSARKENPMVGGKARPATARIYRWMDGHYVLMKAN